MAKGQPESVLITRGGEKRNGKHFLVLLHIHITCPLSRQERGLPLFSATENTSCMTFWLQLSSIIHGFLPCLGHWKHLSPIQDRKIKRIVNESVELSNATSVPGACPADWHTHIRMDFKNPDFKQGICRDIKVLRESYGEKINFLKWEPPKENLVWGQR